MGDGTEDAGELSIVLGDKVARGTFGTVYKVTDKKVRIRNSSTNQLRSSEAAVELLLQTGETLAVKRVRQDPRTKVRRRTGD
jgi:hypothetical protein